MSLIIQGALNTQKQRYIQAKLNMEKMYTKNMEKGQYYEN